MLFQGRGALLRWSTHALLGAAAGSFVGSVSGSDILALAFIGGVFGLIPDIDVFLSGISRTAHRSAATHSILGAALITLFWVTMSLGLSSLGGRAFLPSVPIAASSATVFLAALLHAAADALSTSGCKVFYPFSNRRLRGPVRYDDWALNMSLTLIAVGLILISSAFDLGAPLP